MMDALHKLKSLSESVSEQLSLPTIEDVKNAEEKLKVRFPPSYVEYQFKYPNLIFGTYEPYQLLGDGSYLDLVTAVREARESGLPEHLLPFLEDNGDYFCFDLNSKEPEYEVRYWSHNGTTKEKWKCFLD